LYLHGREIIHRDLKSENVLLDGEKMEEERVKLCDFGLSRSKENLEKGAFTMTKSIGSPLWMAPEITRGERYNFKADIFSFGILIWEMFFERIPYDNLNGIGNIHIRVAIHDDFRPELKEEEIEKMNPEEKKMIELMKKCWKGDPNERPRMEEVAIELNDLGK
jgi:serine/threonine protein kinase